MRDEINLNTYACDCCGAEYEESEMMLDDGALVCVECVERGYDGGGELMSDGRLSVWERNV